MLWRYKKERDELHKQNNALISRAATLEIELTKSHGEISRLKSFINEAAKYDMNASSDDSSPLDAQERAAYLSGVVTFFENYGTKKVNELIAKAKEDLSNPYNQRDYDLTIKGTINGLAQLLDWYDACFSELNQPKQDKVNQ